MAMLGSETFAIQRNGDSVTFCANDSEAERLTRQLTGHKKLMGKMYALVCAETKEFS